MKNKSIIMCFIFSLFGGACNEEFEPYNRIQGLRVLAFKAGKPQLKAGEKTILSALVSEEEVSYHWSWCPFAEGSGSGYRCAISHEQLQEFADQGPGGAGAIVIPAYELGTGKTAEYAHSIPTEVFRQICSLILSSPVPDGFSVPDCKQKFEVQIRLEVKQGDKAIVSVGHLDLLLEEDAVPNNNPKNFGITIHEEGGAVVPLDPVQASPVKRGAIYEFKLSIGEDSAETYYGIRPGGTKAEENRENLVVTWFDEGGDFEHEQTSFLPGSIDIENLQLNTWTPPAKKEQSDDKAKLYFVVRDGRGGVSWEVREVEIIKE